MSHSLFYYLFMLCVLAFADSYLPLLRFLLCHHYTRTTCPIVQKRRMVTIFYNQNTDCNVKAEINRHAVLSSRKKIYKQLSYSCIYSMNRSFNIECHCSHSFDKRSCLCQGINCLP
uniref:Uncharacterized protein n=1 Tax=Rhipicephalus zambeziensis TaxID=60191 RepID=A0A224Y596_9ACAR